MKKRMMIVPKKRVKSQKVRNPKVVHIVAGVLSIFLIGTFALSGCGKQAEQQLPASSQNESHVEQESSQNESGIESESPRTDDSQEAFVQDSADFSIALLQNAMKKGENSMVSPLSVMLALAMTETGADQETLSQMQAVLGKRESLEGFQKNLSNWYQNLPSDKENQIQIADAIWLREDDSLTVADDFLLKNQNLFDADVYKAPFHQATIKEVNDWVSEHTSGHIKKMLDKIKDEDMLYLLNAVSFDAKWQSVYEKYQVSDADFTTAHGTVQKADMMYSTEEQYLELEHAAGFVKPYKAGYSFVAFLPEEGISLENFVDSLSGETFIHAVTNPVETNVDAGLPKFQTEYDCSLNQALKKMGIVQLFDPNKADLTKLGSYQDANLYVSEVKHKTFIEVGEQGTKAGAATLVDAACGSAAITDFKTVILDRPFVYAVVENETGLPVFIGTVEQLE